MANMRSMLSAFRRMLSGGASVLVKAGATSAIESWVRNTLGKANVDEVNTSAAAIFGVIGGSFDPAGRQTIVNIVEEALEGSPLKDSPFGKALEAVIEGADEGCREFMTRNNLTEEEAEAIARDKIFNRLPNILTEMAARKAGKGKPVSDPNYSNDDHDKNKGKKGDAATTAVVAEAKKAGFDFTPIMKWEVGYIRMFLATFHQAILDTIGDADYKQVVGMSRQALKGVELLLKDNAEAVRELLPNPYSDKATKTIDETLIKAVREKPFDNDAALTLIYLSLVKYMSTTDEWIPPHVADWLDALVDFNAFKRWVKSWQETSTTPGLPKARIPAWVETVRPVANEVWKYFRYTNYGLGGVAALALSAGVPLFVSGASGLALASLFQVPFEPMWGISWAAMASGVPLVFVARLIASVYDTQLTFLARAAQAIPIGLDRVMKKFDFNIPTERDQTVSQWAVVNLGRDNATLVTIGGSGIEIGVSIVALFGMIMAFAGPISGAGVVAFCFIMLNVIKALIVIVAESTVRERLRMLEPAVGAQAIRLREKREKRSWMLAFGSGIAAAIVGTLMIVGGSIGTATVVSSKMEQEEQMRRDEAAIDAAKQICTEFRAIKAAYDGDLCADHPNEPGCNGECDNF